MAKSKITLGNDEYAICNVSDNVQEWAGIYSSSEECFSELKQDILDDCKARNYDETTIEKVLMHYKIKFDNYAGEWSGL